MELMEAIYNRRAVRHYSDLKLSRNVFDRLIDAAIQAPSAVNLQPWSFFVAEGRETLAAMADEARRYLLEEVADDSPLAQFKSHAAAADFDLFYGAPALVVICATRDGEFATIDCALAAQNLMLAAWSMGLGSCWIGLAAPWLDSPAGKSYTGISPRCRPVAPIILGYPATWPEAPRRHAPEVHFYQGEN
jgi:nitroreductase